MPGAVGRNCAVLFPEVWVSEASCSSGRSNGSSIGLVADSNGRSRGCTQDSKNRMPSQWLNEMRKQTDPEVFKRIDLLSDAE